MISNPRDVVRSYRNLYRYGLRAVQYSAPARYVLRDEIRHIYRNTHVTDYNAQKIDNTLEFLRSAAAEKGWAHRILKNLIHVWWGGGWNARQKIGHHAPEQLEKQLWRRAYEHYNITVKMFNENFGLCLPVRDFRHVETPASFERKREEEPRSKSAERKRRNWQSYQSMGEGGEDEREQVPHGHDVKTETTDVQGS